MTGNDDNSGQNGCLARWQLVVNWANDTAIPREFWTNGVVPSVGEPRSPSTIPPSCQFSVAGADLPNVGVAADQAAALKDVKLEFTVVKNTHISGDCVENEPCNVDIEIKVKVTGATLDEPKRSVGPTLQFTVDGNGNALPTPWPNGTGIGNADYPSALTSDPVEPGDGADVKRYTLKCSNNACGQRVVMSFRICMKDGTPFLQTLLTVQKHLRIQITCECDSCAV